MTAGAAKPCSHNTPILLVLSGPSGVGKDAVLAALKSGKCPINHVTTVTTRPRRPNEREGIDYHFVSHEQFQSMIFQDKLLEYASVYGNWYGVPRDAVRDALKGGEDVIVKVDVQGAATIKKTVPQAVFIFLSPPSIYDLKLRLAQRKTESKSDLELRLQKAENEMQALPMFDYEVVNDWDQLDKAVCEIKAIIIAEKRRVQPRAILL